MKNNFTPLLDWLKRIWLPISTFIGVVVVVYQFVQLWQGDFKIVTIILLVLGIGVMLASLVFVGFSKTSSPILPSRLTYRYPNYVVPARIGIGVITGILFLGVSFYLYNRSNIKSPDIIIAEFDSRYATKKYEIATRIEDDLTRKLMDNQLDGIVVSRVDSILLNSSDALQLASKENSKIVIWGRYDDLGISIHITFRNSYVPITTPTVSEIPFETVDGGNQELAFTIRSLIPDNMSFVSLFSVGHLFYLENKYQDGHKLFDAAMNSIPDNVVAENEAILHFFNARQLEGNDNLLEDAICEYTMAIQLEPRFAEAYNNLGVLLLRRTDPFGMPYISNVAGKCVSLISDVVTGLYGGYIVFPDDMFAKASELKPDWMLPYYNQIAFQWRFRLKTIEDANQIEANLKNILAKDPSIIGAHILLGNIYFGKNDLVSSEESYKRALEIQPNLVSAHFNLGQIYLRRGDIKKATDEYNFVLSVDPKDAEANLALANLNFDKDPTPFLNTILDSNPMYFIAPDSPYVAAYILQSEQYIKSGAYDLAIASLQKLISVDDVDNFPFEEYLIGVLYAIKKDQTQAEQYYSLAERDSDDLSRRNWESIDPSFRVKNNTSVLTWMQIVEKCFPEENPASWGVDLNFCVSQSPDERLAELYKVFQSNLKYRLHYQSVYDITYGAQCPYVFTFNLSMNKWEQDTVILYKLSNKEKETVQIRQLKQFDGRLLIREVEQEVSYIDMLYVIVYYKNGEVKTLYPDNLALRDSDGNYEVLKTGDELLLTFSGYNMSTIEKVNVVAKGYYTSLVP